MVAAEKLKLASRIGAPLIGINDDSTMATAVETVRLPNRSKPASVCYICHPLDFLNPRADNSTIQQRRERFQQLRLVRALNTWVFSDLKLMMALITHCRYEPENTDRLVPCFQKLNHGLGKLAQAANKSGVRLDHLIYPHANDIARIRAALSGVHGLPGDVRLHLEQRFDSWQEYIERRMPQSLPSERPPQMNPRKVFISYAHDDEVFKNKLEDNLSPLSQAKLIDVWTDRELHPGESLDDSIMERLKSSDLILLLLSPKFFKSDYCMKEFKIALDRHSIGDALAVPIVVRPVMWESTRAADLVLLPEDAKPINQWPDQDLAYINVVRSISRLISAETA